jgi:hypothetical protein
VNRSYMYIYTYMYVYICIYIDLNDEMNCVTMWKLKEKEGNLQKEEGNFHVPL